MMVREEMDSLNDNCAVDPQERKVRHQRANKSPKSAYIGLLRTGQGMVGLCLTHGVICLYEGTVQIWTLLGGGDLGTIPALNKSEIWNDSLMFTRKGQEKYNTIAKVLDCR